MGESPFQIIQINGNTYISRPEDFSPEWNKFFGILRQKPDQPSGPIVLDERDIPSGISAKRWSESLADLKKQLEEIRRRTYELSFLQFWERLPELVEDQIRRGAKPKIVAHSTVNAGKDDDLVEAGRPYAAGLAQAYGVKSEEIVPLSYACTEKVDCQSDDFQEVIRRRLLLSESGIPIAGGGDICSSLEPYEPGYLGAAKAFIDKHQSVLDRSMAVLAQHHPDLHAENLRLLFYDLIVIEFHVYDRTDLLQDAAASRFSGSPQESAIEKAMGTWDTKFAFSKLGIWGWEFKSWWSDVPIETQGFGPLQIIPGLALAAYHEPGIWRDYQSVGLQPNDFVDLKSVVKAIFDPRKMFVLKAMIWDLQLKQLEEVKGLVAPISAPPHLQSEQTAREAALLFGAYSLVQFPEKTEETLQLMLNARYDVLITSLYMLGEIFGIKPHFDGIRLQTGKVCSDGFFGYFHNTAHPGDFCLFSGDVSN